MERYRWLDYVNQFAPGDVASRQEVAQHFGVGRSTARYHLERAVKAGRLHKQYGWTGQQSGWVYALPETMEKLEENNA